MIFPQNFFNFRLDMVEKQVIINLSSYNSKSNASVALSNSEIVFLKEWEDTAFYPFLYCFAA